MEDGDSHTNHPGTPTITVHNVPEAQTYTQTQTQSQTQTPSQQKENIPPQHQHQHQHQHLRTPPDDSSVIETTALDPDDKLVDSMTEDDEVRAHLSDVESSFVPPISPIQVAGPDAGIDDTYLFDAAANRPLPSSPSPSPAPSESASSFGPSSFRRQHDADTASVAGTKQTDTQVPAATFTPEPSPPTRALQPTVESAEPSHLEPRPGDSNLAAETGNSTSTNTSSLEQMSSSPTAAAAARTVSRAISMATSRSAGDETASEHADPDASSHLDSHFDASQDSSFSVDAPSLHDKGSGPNPNRLSVDAGNTPGQALKGGARPKYLRSRHASHNSSTESFAADDDVDSDVTVGMGADYALQSGGAAPAYDMTRSISNTLSRSVSMGSMASGIDEIPDPIRPDALEPLREVDNPMPGRHVDYSDATTPKPKRNSLMPTDTVIARHVRNVEVPESLAQEYKTKGGFTTPLQQQYRKVSEYTPAPPTGTTNRSGKNMTLKEQSNTIERLSKENFDLKLKVMFLSDRLDTLSEEGVKEMISENVELKTKLAVVQRDNKILRRRVKELEKRLRDEEDRPSTARSGYSSDGPETPAFDPDAQEREEELTYLRERVEEYVTEIERLRNENMSNHAEKRRLVETVKTMGDRAGERVGESLGRQEEADVFKDLLEQETARREQADDDNRKLRDEIFRLRQEMNGGIAVGGGAGGGGMHHTTNIYNITRKAKPQSPSRSRPVSGLSGEIDPATSLSQSSTLVEELRRESEQLRHENAELRREVGAQTSMLTSRNREKERLYQEIEDLKLAQRRGGPAPSTVDSLLDRSASRAGAHERSTSRGSGRTRLTMTVEDPDREELENKLAEHRDKINELKLEKQELQREMQTCMEELDASAEAKRRLEEENAALRDELENHVSDMMQLQTERDEALQDHSYIENEFDILRNEAQQEIDTLEAESDQKSEEIQRLLNELQDRSENFDALQEEMRQMSEALVRLEDDQVNKMRRIEQLESEIAEANKEGEELEAKLLESNDKAQRLGVQQESSQGEIAFLREEQEGDKIRIGDLEAALANCEQGLRDERDRTKELDQRLANERKQREIVADREKEEVQQIINELNREVSTAKDEARRLRKNLTSREIEATEWKERLMELESNLREALGDLNGTRSGILKSIAKLQQELENTVRELDFSKSSMLEKDRIIKQRDALLESHGLESRRLAEMLDKERQAHRNTKNQFETFQRTHHHVSRTVTSQDTRILELETSRATDKKKISQLESAFKEQLTERNNLLLVLWTRLSALCGTDWAHDNSLINGRALPSLESVSTMLPGFSKNLLAAIKMIETIVGNFQTRIKSVERELWKEYQTLEHNLESRNKKLERLETIVRSGIAAGNFDAHTKLSQLETAYRALQVENATLQRAHDARTRAPAGYFDRSVSKKTSSNGSHEEYIDSGSPSPSVPTGPHRRDSKIPRSKTTHLETTTTNTSTSTRTKSRSGSMTRSTSNMGPADIERLGTSNGGTGAPAGAAAGPGAGAAAGGDGNQWMFRLRELEYKLKQEREARYMDRNAARQRIQESERQNSELAAELTRSRRKGAGSSGGE